MRKFIFIIIILCIALGIAGFWYWQRNPYSKEILKLEILGPEEAAVSEEVEYTVKYKNNGNVRLEEPRLIFEFPEYTLLEEGLSEKERTLGSRKKHRSDEGVQGIISHLNFKRYSSNLYIINFNNVCFVHDKFKKYKDI